MFRTAKQEDGRAHCIDMAAQPLSMSEHLELRRMLLGPSSRARDAPTSFSIPRIGTRKWECDGNAPMTKSPVAIRIHSHLTAAMST